MYGVREEPKKNDGPRINKDIRAAEVRLIDENGENVGVVSRLDALKMARDLGMDLVEISPNTAPPVCKIADFGKLKYEQQKKNAENKKKQKIVCVKEIQLRPMIEEHDYQVKLRNGMRFLEEGNNIKITLRFRGREMAHPEIGERLIQRFITDVGPLGRVESKPKLNGKQMIMLMIPAK